MRSSPPDLSTVLSPRESTMIGVAGGVSARPPAPATETLPYDDAAAAALRAREFARLDRHDQVYLDHTGGGLYAASQLAEHQDLLTERVLGNPHSVNPASSLSTDLVAEARRDILSFLGASPDEYVVVFTPNASGACKLIADAYPFGPGDRLLLATDDHNSVNGIRVPALARGADVGYLTLRPDDLRLDDDLVRESLERLPDGRRGLFAFPAQSNYSGVRHPLVWITAARARGWDVLLDAAAYLPTARLDLSRWHPDLVVMSWYKVFGYPTGIGSLVVRREMLERMARPWFSGGTIGLVSVALMRHTLAADEVGFEDGTLDYLGIPAVSMGLRFVEGIGVEAIGARVRAITDELLRRLGELRHRDGAPLVRLYGPRTTEARGGTIPFNVLAPDGRVIDFRRVEAAAADRRISLRTGCFCNPGASETARGITAEDMARVFALGRQPTLEQIREVIPDKALGAVRVSPGIVTNGRDVDRLVDLVGSFAA
jgi:selenocysteine lyase/cysteine desulfurase